MCDGSGKERIIVVEQSDSRSHVNRVRILRSCVQQSPSRLNL